MATATVVTSDELLLDDEDSEGAVNDAESEITERSTNEEDEEVDVDVEECSSVEDGPIVIDAELRRRNKRRGHHSSSSGENNDRNKHCRRTSCNSEELKDVECHLETKELWDKFNDLGTEMIITKTGRSVMHYNII